MYILGTKGRQKNSVSINNRRKLNRRDGSGGIVENDKDTMWIHPRESKKPRSLEDLFDLLECSVKETFAAANVNKALKKQANANKQQS